MYSIYTEVGSGLWRFFRAFHQILESRKEAGKENQRKWKYLAMYTRLENLIYDVDS